MIPRTPLHLATLFGLLAVMPLGGFAQSAPCLGEHLSGAVHDETGAVIPGAAVDLDGTSTHISDAAGRFNFACVALGEHTLRASATSFAEAKVKLRMRSAAQNVVLTLLVKGEDVSIDATSDPTGLNNENTGGAKTLSQNDLSKMADDPDDFQRQLQVLAAAGGGTPGNATISVDGFQEGSALPPKGSIAFIRVNPDLFSSEYGNPPYQGGRIEIYTKPSGSKIHGALFMTYSPTAVNARDPFASTRAAVGKQRYGFEFSGPIKPNKWDYSLNLEHREIDDFAVVNAYVLDSTFHPVRYVENVPQGQHLWIASARSGMQLSKQNLLTLSYTANVSNLDNVGAGGYTLRESSYDSLRSDHAIRAVLISTLSPRMVHEARISLTLRNREDTPHSFAPFVSVAGAFNAGGVSTGQQKIASKIIEINDDILYNRGKHSVKAGILSAVFLDRNRTPNGFNGQYYFDDLDTYANAVQSGGNVSQYSVTTGSLAVHVSMNRTAFYIQDQYKVTSHVQLALGFRWQFQNDPSMYKSLMPRFGIAWSPDKKQHLVFRVRSGLFTQVMNSNFTGEIARLNGRTQTPQIYYNVPYNSGPTLLPAPITTQRAFARKLHQPYSWQSQFAVEYAFPHGWNVQGNVYPVQVWSNYRTRNINQPLNGNPYGPRPYGANLNLLQIQQSGRFRGIVQFYGLDQHAYKRAQIFLGYLHMGFHTDADDPYSSPQNAYSDAGEYSRPGWQSAHRVFMVGTLNLPGKLALSSNSDITSGDPFNITTGIDSNGDGVYNDRPLYATSSTLPQDIVHTRYGDLTAQPGNGAPIQRNLGTLPWMVHVDANLSRSFKLNKSTDARTLTANIRASNLLNHRNVTAMGAVLNSKLFDVPFSGENGRRIEAGLRFSF